MAITLEKGQRISLEKASGTALGAVAMGLGWDVARSSGLRGWLGGGDDSIDLDASALLFDPAGRLVDAVWFRQLRSRDGSIRHSGDNLTGEGDGDDETITVDLPRVPAEVQSIVFTVNSFRGQSFDRVANAFCRVYDAASGREIARYDLSARGPHTAMVMAKLYRHGGEWKMHAIGENAEGRTYEQLVPLARTHL